MQLQIKAFNSTAHKKLSVAYFQASKSTAKAISITALLYFYRDINNKANFGSKLSIENNVQELEVALQRCRRSDHFDTAKYSNAITALRNNKTMCKAYALELLALCTN